MTLEKLLSGVWFHKAHEWSQHPLHSPTDGKAPWKERMGERGDGEGREKGRGGEERAGEGREGWGGETGEGREEREREGEILQLSFCEY